MNAVTFSKINNIRAAGQFGVIAMAQATKALVTIYTVGLMLSITGAICFFSSQMSKAIKIGD